jgi:hypothetical protein
MALLLCIPQQCVLCVLLPYSTFCTYCQLVATRSCSDLGLLLLTIHGLSCGPLCWFIRQWCRSLQLGRIETFPGCEWTCCPAVCALLVATAVLSHVEVRGHSCQCGQTSCVTHRPMPWRIGGSTVILSCLNISVWVCICKLLPADRWSTVHLSAESSRTKVGLSGFIQTRGCLVAVVHWSIVDS